MTGAAISSVNYNDIRIDLIAFLLESKLVTFRAGDAVMVWNFQTEAVASMISGHVAYSIAFAPDGLSIVAGTFGGTIRLLSNNSYASGVDSSVKLRRNSSVDFSPDSSLIASATSKGTVNRFNGKAGAIIASWNDLSEEGRRHYWNVIRRTRIAFSPYSQLLATASSPQGAVVLRNVEGGEDCFRIDNKSGSISALAFSLTSCLLATSSPRCAVQLWTMETGVLGCSLCGHSLFVNTAAFSPDSQALASGSDEELVMLWNVNSGAKCGILCSHNNEVNCIAFSANSSLLGSGCRDRMVIVWNLHCCEQLHAINCRIVVSWLKFFATGRTLMADR